MESPNSKIRDSALAMAVRSGLNLNLIVSDGLELGKRIPLSDVLVENSDTEPNSNPTVSYQKIRRLALANLFQYNGGIVPMYAEKNFGTHFTCNRNGNRMEFKNDSDFKDILEQAAEENLLDENDDILLEIYCGFTNNFPKNNNFKIIRKQASEATNNVLKKLTRWIQKASTAFHKTTVCSEEDMDYIVVGDTNGSCVDEKEEIDNFWASRVVRFLVSHDLGKDTHESNPINANDEVSLIENVFDAVISFANEFFTEVSYRNGDFWGQMMDRRQRGKAKLTMTRNFSTDKIKMIPDKNVVMEQKEEIMFHPADEQAPEEWKIFFSDSIEKDTVFVCESVEDDTDDVIFVHAPHLNDIQSIDSDDESGFEDIDEPSLKDDDQNRENGSNASSCENWEML